MSWLSNTLLHLLHTFSLLNTCSISGNYFDVCLFMHPILISFLPNLAPEIFSPCSLSALTCTLPPPYTFGHMRECFFRKCIQYIFIMGCKGQCEWGRWPFNQKMWVQVPVTGSIHSAEATVTAAQQLQSFKMPCHWNTLESLAGISL